MFLKRFFTFPKRFVPKLPSMFRKTILKRSKSESENNFCVQKSTFMFPNRFFPVSKGPVTFPNTACDSKKRF